MHKVVVKFPKSDVKEKGENDNEIWRVYKTTRLVGSDHRDSDSRNERSDINDILPVTFPSYSHRGNYYTISGRSKALISGGIFGFCRDQ